MQITVWHEIFIGSNFCDFSSHPRQKQVANKLKFPQTFSRKNSLQSNASVNSSCAQPAPGLLRSICPPCQSRGWAFAGCGFYGYRLKFWLFYGYRLIFFQLRLTKKLIIYFFCFKGLNINQRVFFVSFKQNKGLRIISG